jgi:hypothetical protein
MDGIGAFGIHQSIRLNDAEAVLEAVKRVQRGTMTVTNLIACHAVLAYNMNSYDLAPQRIRQKRPGPDHDQ